MPITFEHLVNPRLLIEYASNNMWDMLPQSLLAMAVLLGGLIVWWIFKYIITRIWITKQTSVRLKSIQNGQFIFGTEVKRTGGSIKNVILETIFIVGVVIIFWVAAHVAGFNFWTNTLVLSSIGLVATYMFGPALQNMGATYFLYLSDKVEEKTYIEVGVGPGKIEGYVLAIHPLYADLDYFDETSSTVRHRQVPTTMLLSLTVDRNEIKEAVYEQAFAAQFSAFRIPRRRKLNV